MIFNFAKRCETCETLRELLEVERATSKRLLDALLVKNIPIVEEPIKETYEPIQTRVKPWRIKQQELEEQSRREAAAILARRTTELEEEVGIKDDTAISK